MNLTDLSIGQTARISEVGGEGALRQHFLDMGVIPGEDISLIKYAPMGDPMELMIHGYELTLRLDDAKKIQIEKLDSRHNSKLEKNISAEQSDKEQDGLNDGTHSKEGNSVRKLGRHPGYGEDYDLRHEHKPGDKKVKGTLTFALVGNQNCGKTTLFNQLTGSNQHVGNFPGVTVDRKSGSIKGYPKTEVVDLPGIYSLSPYTSEEIVSREFIIKERPTAIINIVDATNIERNLYLTMQLLELGLPMVLALNMMDELTGNGGSIRINEMEEMLKIPVIPISAAKNEGIDELIKHAMHVASYQEKPGRDDFCEKGDHNGAVHRAMHGVMNLIEDHAEASSIPLRFAASKLIEGDSLIKDALKLDDNETVMMQKIVSQMECERGLDSAAAIADMRFLFIRRLCDKTVIKPKESREHMRSRKMDKILTGKWTAIPLFVAIMVSIFYLTFNVIGAFLQDLLASGIEYLTQLVDEGLTAANVAAPVHSLIIDAIFNGVGTVLSFIPIIVILYLFLSILEDSGYMARVAFFMDKLLRKVGLSGRSIVPLLIGFGCTVPATMSTRTLPSARDRKMTSLLIPFMSCSAKMPVYTFLAAAFFPRYSGLIMVAMYFIGILIAIIVAFISKKTSFKDEAVPFVMELPNYRMPGFKNTMLLMWDKAKDFLQRAFTVIFVGTIIVWFLQSFDFGLHMVDDSSESILAAIAGLIAPIFKPLGLGDWRIVTALISGFMAKESIVSMISITYGTTEALVASLGGIQAFSFLIFCLLYTPCVAAVAAIRKEQGRAFAVKTVIFQCSVAWLAAFIARLIGQLIF